MTSAAINRVHEIAMINLTISDNFLKFNYKDAKGKLKSGCLEEWLGNESNGIDLEQISFISEDGYVYYQVGACDEETGALLIRDDANGTICYYNDWNQELSDIGTDIGQFLNNLH